MKKSIFSYFSHLSMMLVAILFLASCDGTEDGLEAGPSITITPTEATVDVGQTVDFSYNVVSDRNLEEIRVIAMSQTQETITDFTNNDSHTGSFSFTPQVSDANTTVTITVEAEDRNGNRSSSSVNVTVNEAVEPIAISTVTAVLMGAQDNATLGSFANASTGEVFRIADARNNSSVVDLVYIVGSAANGQGAIIGSTLDNSVEFTFTQVTTWTGRKDTKFKETTLSESDFNAITDGNDLVAAYENGTQPDNDGQEENYSSRVNQISQGDVFSFLTSDGKHALAYVSAIDAQQNGQITLNIKIVQ